MRVYDAFIFANEFACVAARRAGWVDLPVTHCLVEAGETFTGYAKPLLWAERGADVAARSLPTLPVGGVWEREAAQRDALYPLLASLDPEPDDLVLLTDADEIVDPEKLDEILAATELGPVCLDMDVFVYDLTYRLPGPWPHPKAARWRDLPPDLDGLRQDFSLPMVADAGWHCSWFGGPRRSALKARSFSHTEFSGPAFATPEAVSRRMAAHTHIDGTPLLVGDWPVPDWLSHAFASGPDRPDTLPSTTGRGDLP